MHLKLKQKHTKRQGKNVGQYRQLAQFIFMKQAKVSQKAYL